MKEKTRNIFTAIYRRSLSIFFTFIIIAACFFGCFNYNEIMELPNLQKYCFNLSIFFTSLIAVMSLFAIFGQKQYKQAVKDGEKKYFSSESKAVKNIFLIISKLSDIFVIGCFAVSGHFIMAFLWLIHTGVDGAVRKEIQRDKEDGIEDSELISSQEWSQWKSSIFSAVSIAKTNKERELVKDKISDVLKNIWGILKEEANLKAKAQGKISVKYAGKSDLDMMTKDLIKDLIDGLTAEEQESKLSKEKMPKSKKKDDNNDEVLEIF